MAAKVKPSERWRACKRHFNVIDAMVHQPLKMCVFWTIVPLCLAVVGASSLKLNDRAGWDVRDSLSSRSYDSYIEAMVALRTAAVGLTQDDVLPRGSVETSRLPLDGENYLTIFFETQQEGGSVLDFLSEIEQVEAQVMENPYFAKICFANDDPKNDHPCARPISIVPFFKYGVGKSPNSKLLPRDFPADASATFTVFRLGMPLEGFNNQMVRPKEQYALMRSLVVKVVESSADFAARFDAGVVARYDFLDVDGYTVKGLLPKDAAFAGGSFVAVLIFLYLHTKSKFLAVMALSTILLVFPVTFFIYNLVFGISHFGTLQVLAIYVILGIGVDDAVVLFDAYEESRLHMETLEARMRWTYEHAMSAMAVTSITTFAAFVVTSMSPILNIRVFGIFASVMVVVNFSFVLTILPCVLIIYETKIVPMRDRAFKEKDVDPEDLAMYEGEKGALKKETIEPPSADLHRVPRFYRDHYAPFVVAHRLKILLVSFAVVVGMIFAASQIETSTKPINDLYSPNHTLSKMRRLQKDVFEFDGRSEYEEMIVVLGLEPYDRSGIKERFNPNDRGTFRYAENFSPSKEVLKSFCLKLNTVTHFRANKEDCETFEWDNESVPFVEMDVILDVMSSAKYEQRAKVRDSALVELEAILHQLDPDGSQGLGGFVMLTSQWSPWFDASSVLLHSAMRGIGIGLAMAFAVLLFATRDLMLTFLTLLSLSVVVGNVLGTIVLVGFQLGFIESIAIVTLVGLSVDYVVHVSIAYAEAPQHYTRQYRTVKALTRMGVSVLGGATTTLAAAFFLFFCQISWLSQFGKFLFITISWSVVVANTLYPALLATLGPGGELARSAYSPETSDIAADDDYADFVEASNMHKESTTSSSMHDENESPRSFSDSRVSELSYDIVEV